MGSDIGANTPGLDGVSSDCLIQPVKAGFSQWVGPVKNDRFIRKFRAFFYLKFALGDSGNFRPGALYFVIVAVVESALL